MESQPPNHRCSWMTVLGWGQDQSQYARPHSVARAGGQLHHRSRCRRGTGAIRAAYVTGVAESTGSLQRQQPDGLYPLCSTWHTPDVVLPAPSFVRPPPFLCALMPSHPGDSPQQCCLCLPHLPFRCLVVAVAPCSTPWHLCACLRGKNDAQQAGSSPISQFSSPVSLPTDTPSPIPSHCTAHTTAAA